MSDFEERHGGLIDAMAQMIVKYARSGLPQRRRRLRCAGDVRVGKRAVCLSPAERRAICLGIYRPKLPPRGMPAYGRLFKGHRP